MMQPVTDQSRNLPLPQGFAPKGVEQACFDEQTLSLIKYALPPRYQQIFAHLLSSATTDPRSAMHPSLFHTLGEGTNEAIILYRSVARLATSQDSPAGPETYQKAILIFEALKVLRRTFHRGYTEIRMPLGKREIHVPSLLQSLRDLYDEYDNEKVKGLAIKVAKRLTSGAFAKDAPQPPARVAPEVKEVLMRLLQEHGVDESKVRQMSLSEACTIIAQTMHTERRVFAEKGELVGVSSEKTRKSRAKKGDSNGQQGEFVTLAEREPTPASTPEGELVGKESPTLVSAHRKTRRCSSMESELDEIFRMESPETAPQVLFSATMGDSVAAVSISVQSPSRMTSKEERTLIDTEAARSPYQDTRDIAEIRREAKLYTSLFDNKKSRNWMGSLIDVLRATPPLARRYAAVATMVYSYVPMPDGRRVRSPGGFFTDACKRYRQPGVTIPAEVRAWAETGQSLREMEQALQQGYRHPAQARLPFAAEQTGHDEEGQGTLSRLREEESVSLSPGVGQYGSPRAAQSRSRLRTWMSSDDAERLRNQILREGQAFKIGAQVYPGDREGEFVVVTNWDGVKEEMANEAEWTRYFEATKACY